MIADQRVKLAGQRLHVGIPEYGEVVSFDYAYVDTSRRGEILPPELLRFGIDRFGLFAGHEERHGAVVESWPVATPCPKICPRHREEIAHAGMINAQKAVVFVHDLREVRLPQITPVDAVEPGVAYTAEEGRGVAG